MGKIAFVFSGQGAQYSGMGKELYELGGAAKAVFELADTIRPKTSDQCFAASLEEISITSNTQPCLFCVGLAAAKALKEAGIKPDLVAGFSLGEVAALTFAGIFEFEDGFSFVCNRGEAMQKAAENEPGSMVAVLKLSDKQVEEICESFDKVYPVNYNCPGQLVVAMRQSEFESFVTAVTEAGGRAKQLKVSGGFHSPFMKVAADILQSEIDKIDLHIPNMTIYSNVTAKPYTKESASELILKQVTSPVQWQKTIENMVLDGVDTFIEVGAGKTLCGLIKKTVKGVRILNVQDKASLEKTLKELSI